MAIVVAVRYWDHDKESCNLANEAPSRKKDNRQVLCVCMFVGLLVVCLVLCLLVGLFGCLLGCLFGCAFGCLVGLVLGAWSSLHLFIHTNTKKIARRICSSRIVAEMSNQVRGRNEA